MSKSTNWETLGIGFVSVVVGLIAMAFTGSIFNLFFVAIVIAVLWDYTNKVNDLQVRLSRLESKEPNETTGTSGS
ncbi:MAG: hypothetical protein M1368_06390 [Thaumarchaeota archaeon]|nr:hypothetical protein [Nitrososphaerota archaeon]